MDMLVEPTETVVATQHPAWRRWLIHDSPYLAMLALVLTGVVFRLPVLYWVMLMPVFAIISIVAGWRLVDTDRGRAGLVYKLLLSWGAVLVAVFILYDSGVRGVLNANGNSLSMMILLALGTFVGGVQAGVWRICAVGAVLFATVPALGWLDQSPLQWSAAAVVIVALGAAAWWLIERPRG